MDGAFVFTVLLIVVAALNIIANPVNITVLDKASSILTGGVRLAVPAFIIYVILDAAKKNDNTGLATEAGNAIKPYVAVSILAFFGDILAKLPSVNVIFGIVYLVCLVAAYCMYLKLLKKASR